MKFFYEGINNIIHRHPFFKSCVHFASLFCPWMIAIFYALFILKIALEYPSGIYLLFIKPLSVLICTSLLRIFINRPRPYQKYTIEPIGNKKRDGHSFPSIHSSLALSIALTVVGIGPNMSLLLFVLAVVVTITRLITGEHYLSDILASILIAVGIYLI